MKTIKFMTPNRVLIETPARNINNLLAVAAYMVKASDGVFVPKCDLEQYNNNDRPALETKFIA